jgi:hypothetical protein
VLRSRVGRAAKEFDAVQVTRADGHHDTWVIGWPFIRVTFEVEDSSGALSILGEITGDDDEVIHRRLDAMYNATGWSAVQRIRMDDGDLKRAGRASPKPARRKLSRWRRSL